uniref:Ubiquitin-like-conjugating enzyme ATG10 n=1 Tax=Meloidogyne incognita TaxID=6306 RepID=A0A914MRH2_MELIC
MNDFVCDISGKKYKRCSSICYSEVYSVPVFWFNIYNFEDFKNFTFRKETNENEFLEFISQGEHPFLGIAFYNIHPCKTAELMQNFKGNNYVLCFLSLLNATIFYFDWPLEFFKNAC